MKNRFEDNKRIIQMCPNYYSIISMKTKEEDKMSKKILTIYEEYIFMIDINNHEDLERIKTLDKLVYRYFIDISFRKDILDDLERIKIKKTENNLLESIIDKLVELYNFYLEDYTKKMYIPKWINI